MDRRIVDVVVVLGLAGMAAVAWAQHRQLDELGEALHLMQARVDAAESGRPSVRRAAVQPAIDDTHPAEAVTVAVVPKLLAEPASGHADHRTQAVLPPPPTFDPADPTVRGQLREVIAEEQESLREERWDQRAQQREARLRTQLQDLAQKTEMDEIVTEQLTDLLVVEQTEASDIFRQAREDFSWDEARDKVATLRAATDARARELLDEDEFAEYEKMRTEETSRWGGPGRRGNIPPGSVAP